MKFCKRTFQGYSSKLNKSREKSFCLSKRKKEKTMNPNNLSRDHHRDKYNSVAWKENSQNSCFLVKNLIILKIFSMFCLDTWTLPPWVSCFSSELFEHEDTHRTRNGPFGVCYITSRCSFILFTLQKSKNGPIFECK